mmetsp:Transcript_1896/g.3015  ORF Transcript_1896/g.3015 Transcript_1896/m.3015 type:complete len:305 (-) Transcript_1896:217-1131(-)|eukprot:CAMPEP_0185025206 /NCGR_PEP_ID=MMETSP1103-20130426/8253_1 /TAXON_ID=36769 /ORGANISM="Paraphysomonas bandaiensis, Strain Caron Lab Isolate" /LENGTH=304 /DNA_ID=CAMNT_0027558355 /DNA_START=126 /DNA_END=1040 /DNA_ORIENTATION=-
MMFGKPHLNLSCSTLGMETLTPIPPPFLVPRPFEIKKPVWCQAPTTSVIFEECGTGRERDIGEEAFYIIGRNERCDIILGEIMVSRCHAVLCHNGLGDVYLIDLGSSHGTFIGNHRLVPYTPTLVKRHSVMRFGSWEKQYIVREYPKPDDVLAKSKYCESVEEQLAMLNAFRNITCLTPTNSQDRPMNVDKSEEVLPVTEVGPYRPARRCSYADLGDSKREMIDISQEETLHTQLVHAQEALHARKSMRRSFSLDSSYASPCARRLSTNGGEGGGMCRKKVRFSEGDLSVVYTAETATGRAPGN